MKLSEENREALGDLKTHEGVKVLIAVMEHLVAKQGQTLLSYSLEEGEKGLLIEKAKYEGAVSLVRNLKQRLLAKN